MVVSKIFYFHPIWGRFPFWLIIFKWVETTNQVKSVVKVEQIPSSKTHKRAWHKLTASGPLSGSVEQEERQVELSCKFFSPKTVIVVTLLRHGAARYMKLYTICINMFWRYVGCSPDMLNSCFCFGTPPQAAASHLIQKIPRILSLMNQFKILFRDWQKWNRG